MDAGPPALRWLSGELNAVAADQDGSNRAGRRVRRQAAESLTTAVALGFIDDVKESGMVYAGQFDDLRLLQPHSGNLYLNLLLDTPDWFAEQRRVMLVPALRDLYPQRPGLRDLADIRQIAEHEELETWELRLALFCALAQWGDRELIDGHLRELERAAANSDEEDRLGTVRELAQTHHLLRDYAASAAHYRKLLRGAERIGAVLAPADYYNAACSMSLTGDLGSALDELERCVKLMRSGTVDPSLLLKRALFEGDPEIANIRKTDRFADLLKIGFPEDGDRGQ